jgi:hypothetical protein
MIMLSLASLAENAGKGMVAGELGCHARLITELIT